MKNVKMIIILFMVVALFIGCNNNNLEIHDDSDMTEIGGTIESSNEAEMESSTDIESTIDAANTALVDDNDKREEGVSEETSFVSKEINEEDSEEVIKEYVRCLGHDWNRVANFYEKVTVEGWIEFFNNEYHRSENVGILNVNNAELIDYMEVSFDDVKRYLSWPLDSYEDREVKAYVALINYSVNQPDPGFFNDGLSYDLYTVVKEDGLWRMREHARIYEEELDELGYF